MYSDIKSQKKIRKHLKTTRDNVQERISMSKLSIVLAYSLTNERDFSAV